MNRYLTHILLFLTTIFVLSSCIGDNVLSESCLNNNDVEISFTLFTDASNLTRAEDETTWGDKYDQNLGTLYETYVNPNDLQVLLYNTSDGTFITKLENIYSIRVDESDSKHIYNYSGKIPAKNLSSSTLNAKVVVLANCPTYTPASDAPLSDMYEQTFDYEAAHFGSDHTDYIPMWGVKSVEATLTPGVATNLGDINLLRSMAKVRVTVSSDMAAAGTKLSAVKLNRYNNQGYYTPKGYDKVTDIKQLYTDYTSDPAASFHPVPNAVATDPASIDFIKVSDSEYYIYVPEYDNSSDDASITVNVGTESASVEYTFKIDKYEDNGTKLTTPTPVSLIRNHIYTYEIQSIQTGNISIQFTELPWNVVTSSIGWNVGVSAPFDAPLYAWKLNRTKEITVNGTKTKFMNVPSIDDAADAGDPEAIYAYVSFPKYYDSDGKPQYLQDQRGGAAFYFILNKPEGAVWTAHLTNTDDFEFETTKEIWKYYLDPSDETEPEEHYCATTGIVRGSTTVTDSKGNEYISFQPYQIMVKPKKGHSWYSFASDAKTTTKSGKTVYSIKDNWDSYITLSGSTDEKWGGKYWETSADEGGAGYGETSGPYTDLYITVSLDGVNETLVPINPVVSDDVKTYYKDSDGKKRRFAIGNRTEDKDYYVRIWQLKARRDDSTKDNETVCGYDNEGMASNNTFNSTFSKDNK